MSVYGDRVIAVYPGDFRKVFDAATPTVDVPSAAIAIPAAVDGALAGYSVTYYFASAPDAVTLYVQEAEENVEAAFQTVDTLSSTTGGKTSYSGNITKFVRIIKHLQTNGGALTVSVGR